MMHLAKSVLCAFGVLGCAASAFAVTDAQLQGAIRAIRADKKNQPRYCQYKHDLILGDLAAWGRTNALSHAQSASLARAMVEHANASDAYKESFDAAWATLDGCTNVAHRIGELNGLVGSILHTYSYNAVRGVALAEKILAENEAAFVARFGAAHVLRMRESIACRALGLYRDLDRAGFDRHYAAIRSAKAPDERSRKSFDETRRRALAGMLRAYADVDLAGAKARFAKDVAEFTQGEIDSFREKLADVATAQKDRAAFDAILADFKAYPANRRTPYRNLIKKLKKFDPATADRLLAEELAASKTPEDRYAVLAIQQGFNDPQAFEYGFADPGRYGRWRAALLARKAIHDANPTNRACNFYSGAGPIGWEVERMVEFDDLETAKAILAEGRRRWPGDRKLALLAARVQACEGDAAGAAAALAGTLALKGTTAAQSNDVLRVCAFLRGEGLDGFNRVNAPLKLTSAQRLKALRATSKQLFECRRYADCQAIFKEIVENVYRPDPRKRTRAECVKHAPQTAGAFAASKWYGDWNGYETRFKPYGDSYGESAETDVKRHLRDVAEPACDPAWRTGVKILCDDAGAHVYVRCDDPGIAEVVDGVRDAGGLELFFAPGGLDAPYHSVFFEGLPKCDDPHGADWCAAGPHYRRSVDCLFKDAAVTPDGVVAHLSIPWLGFHDGLPLDGNAWNLGVVRSCKGGMQSVGGVVHELSRGLLVEFAFTPEQATALKRRTCVMAFNRYRKIRNDPGDFIQRWNDPVLGDPAFFQAKVAPLLETLDKAGETLLKPCADADVAAFYVDFVPRWAEIKYVISDLRTRYLNDRLFAE